MYQPGYQPANQPAYLLLSLLLFFRKHTIQRRVDQIAQHRVNQRANQCRFEAGDVEAIQHRCCAPEHQRVDDEQEQADGDDGDRQRQNHQQGFDESVEQADDESGYQRGLEAVECHAVINIGHKK